MNVDLLSVIDQFLTTLTLKSVQIEYRVSQRGGRLFRKSLIWIHENFGKLRAKRIWDNQGEETFRVINAAETIQASPGYPSFFRMDGKSFGIVEELLSGKIQIDDTITLKLDSVSWFPDPLSGTFSLARLQFHSLEWVGHLINAFHREKNSQYLRLAKDLTHKWINECLHREDTGNIWSDHATALRGVILCRLWVVCQNEEPNEREFRTELFFALLRHGEKLSHPLFYRRDHNHGVSQAYALFVIGVIVRTHPLSAGWITLGQKRLEAQMSENVSDEGIHREHSPYYHFYVFRHFFYASLFGKALGFSFSREFEIGLTRMLGSGAYLFKPDNSLSSMGDSCKSSPVLIEEDERDQWPVRTASEFLYASSSGRQGQPPKQPSMLFPHAGVGYFRSGWGVTEPFDQERWMSIRTGTFPTSHIHRDVGSVELYAYGDDLIVDSGGPYVYGHPLRGDYFLRTKAHNTVVVDHQDQGIGSGHIQKWETNEKFDFLQFEHETYEWTNHRRSLIFVRPDYFIILDQLQSQKKHHYSQVFHLNEKLHVTLKELDVMTENANGGPTLRVIPFLKDGLTARIHTGSLNPVQGWRCLAEKDMAANTAIEYQQVGSSVQFGVLLIPESPNGSMDTQVQALSGESGFALNLKVRVGNRTDEIQLSTTGMLTVCPIPS